MKDIRKAVFTVILLLLGASFSWSQIPVEVMVGNKQVQYQGYFFNTLDKQQRLSFFGMSRFAVDYENQAFNNSFISSQLTYNFSRSWGISAGASFAGQTLSPLVALSYTKYSQNGDFFLNLFPSILLGEEINFELTGLAIYSPKITKNLRLFSQLIFTTQYNSRFDQHLFSNQQVRLGVGIKDLFQVGLGVDNTMIGPISASESDLVPSQSIKLQNFGLFIRKEI